MIRDFLLTRLRVSSQRSGTLIVLLQASASCRISPFGDSLAVLYVRTGIGGDKVLSRIRQYTNRNNLFPVARWETALPVTSHHQVIQKCWTFVAEFDVAYTFHPLQAIESKFSFASFIFIFCGYLRSYFIFLSSLSIILLVHCSFGATLVLHAPPLFSNDTVNFGSLGISPFRLIYCYLVKGFYLCVLSTNMVYIIRTLALLISSNAQRNLSQLQNTQNP